MTETMKRTLDALHRIPYRSTFSVPLFYSTLSRVEVIPHGVPAFPRELLFQRSRRKASRLLISNGLIHQGKGLEYAIAAIPALLSSYPDSKYFILGTPHPTGTGTMEYYR